MPRLTAFITLLVALVLPGVAHGADLYVSPGDPECSDATTIAVAADARTPWCSPAPALRQARPGDVVHLAAATYGAQFRPLTSGTADQPIVYQADGQVTIAAPAGTVAVMLSGVHDIALRGGSESFVFTAGGFNPLFAPPPDLTSVRRLSISISPSPLIKIWAESYFAVTASSFQFGAAMYMEAKLGPISQKSAPVVNWRRVPP